MKIRCNQCGEFVIFAEQHQIIGPDGSDWGCRFKSPAKDADAPEESVSYQTLRGRYQAVLHERDALIDQVNKLTGDLAKLASLDTCILICDGCGTKIVAVAPSPARIVALQYARKLSWYLNTPSHLCANCKVG